MSLRWLRDHRFDDDLVRVEDRFPSRVLGRMNVKVLHRDPLRPNRSLHRDRRIEGDQHWGDVRRVHHETVVSTENAVESVLAGYGEAVIAALPETIEIAAVIPAARFLAQIAPDRALVPKLGTCHLSGSHGEAGKETGDDRAGRKLRDSRQGAYGDISMVLLDSREAWEVLHCHNPSDREDLVPHAAEEICPTGMNSRIRHGEESHCLVDRTGAHILERRHHECTSLRSFNAETSRTGDMGVSVTRMPVAL